MAVDTSLVGEIRPPLETAGTLYLDKCLSLLMNAKCLNILTQDNKLVFKRNLTLARIIISLIYHD